MISIRFLLLFNFRFGIHEFKVSRRFIARNIYWPFFRLPLCFLRGSSCSLFSVLAHHFFELDLSVVTQSFVHSLCIQWKYGFWCHVNNRQFVLNQKHFVDENCSFFFFLSSLSLYLFKNNWFNFNLLGISFFSIIISAQVGALIDQRIRFIR